MPKAIVFMTALVPTVGHQYLIEFSSNFMSELRGELHVIINARSFEPVKGKDRLKAISNMVKNHELWNVKVHLDETDDAPQNPEDHPDFWNYWATMAKKYAGNDITHVFASEKYGIEVAKSLDAEFITCDIARQVFDVKSSWVRENLNGLWRQIMPEMRPYFKKTVTIFGSESTGKTTMTKQLADFGYILPEYAREYLETVGEELTEEKMLNIANGQYSMQAAIGKLNDRPFVIQDTDLLSTIGYYKIIGMQLPMDVFENFLETKSDLYIVMNSKIPFEKDILRYGGDVRQSDDQFWIDLLNDFDCNYYVVQNVDPIKQYYEVRNVLRNLFTRPDIRDFVRE